MGSTCQLSIVCSPVSIEHVSEFFWVGNHPGLDLFNTAAADDNGEPVELLDGFDALATWLGDAQLVTPTDVRTVPARQRLQLLRWTRRLRDTGRQVVDRDVARPPTIGASMRSSRRCQSDSHTRE